MNVLERFAFIFQGRTDVAGIFDPRTSQTYTKHEPVTLSTYQRHIDGTESLGIFPLRDDNTVRWSCIDVDTQDLDLALRLRAFLATHNVNSYIERTKSKGYHVWVFWSHDVPASWVRRLFRATLTAAGAPPKTELFPKQDAILSPGKVGNFVNLPYDGRLVDKRVMIEDTGRVISLVDFLGRVVFSPFPDEFAGATKTVADLKPANPSGKKPGFVVSFGDRQDSFYDGPPPLCVLTAMDSDAPDGTRNETLTRLVGYWAGYAGYDFDDTVAKAQEWNGQLLDPLSEDELNATVEKIMRGSYTYGCARIREVQVFKDGCNWTECGLYRPGAADELPILNNGRQYDYNPVQEPDEAKEMGEGSDWTPDEPLEDVPDTDQLDERAVTALLGPAKSLIGEYVSLGRTITDAPRIFHLANSLILMATALGKKVQIRSFGSRAMYPNLYIVAVAPSGFYHKSTTTNLGMDVLKVFSPGKPLAEIMTPEAFIVEMDLDSDRVLYIDEFGDMMRMWNRREYLNAMKGRLISAYDNRELSKSIRGSKGTGETNRVEDPCLSLMGTTTQHLLVAEGAMKLEDLQSGFTARILWVWSEKKERFKRDWPWDTQSDINKLGDRFARIGEDFREGATTDFTRAKDTYFDWLEGIEKRYERGVSAETSGVVSRMGTFVMKVAVLLAVSEGTLPANQILYVEADHVKRSIAFVEWCVQRQEQMVSHLFQFNEFDRGKKKLLDTLKIHGGRMSYSDAVRVLSREKRRVDELIDTLRAGQEIRVVVKTVKGRGRPSKVIALPGNVREDEQDVA